MYTRPSPTPLHVRWENRQKREYATTFPLRTALDSESCNASKCFDLTPYAPLLSAANLVSRQSSIGLRPPSCPRFLLTSTHRTI